jgi:spore germination protein GerM
MSTKLGVCRIAAAVLACAAMSSAAGCGIPTDDAARALDPQAAPYRVVTRDRADTPAGTHRIVVFLVRDGALAPVPRRIPAAPTPAAVLTALTAGPTREEQAEGLTTALPLDQVAHVARVEGSTVTVALPTTSDASSRSDAIFGFGQLVLTLTALPSVSGVRFEDGGKPLQVPRSDGALSGSPLGRLDYRDLIDPE